METLADIEKQMAEGKSAEAVVGSLADKTPEVNGAANVHHRDLAIGSLLGYDPEGDGRPVLGEGEPFTIDGQSGVLHDDSLEAKTLGRWRDREFLEIERHIAKAWRAAVEKQDFDSLVTRVKELIPDWRPPKNLEEAKSIADKVTRGEVHRKKVLDLALDLVDATPALRKRVLARWNRDGMKSLEEFAPYMAHVLAVDVFFAAGLSNGLISGDRKSNKVDMAYLYYLPFTKLFVSSDNLHARAVPFFLRKDQAFLVGKVLKEDLAKLEEYYDNLPADVKDRGVYMFAMYPPLDLSTMTASIWDQYSPDWRDQAKKHTLEIPKQHEGMAKHMEKLAEAVKEAKKNPQPGGVAQNPDHLLRKRVIRARKGKWERFPEEVRKSKKRFLD